MKMNNPTHTIHINMMQFWSNPLCLVYLPTIVNVGILKKSTGDVCKNIQVDC